MKVKMTVGFTVALLIIIFTLQNVEVVSIRFLFWELAVSRALLIFVIFSSGLLGGYLLGSFPKGTKKNPSNNPRGTTQEIE